jgi:hypothetical protein
MTRIILICAAGAIDRGAVMRLAHAKYRSGVEPQSFGASLAWSWAQARRHRDAGGEPARRRLETMLAHHIQFQRAAHAARDRSDRHALAAA